MVEVRVMRSFSKICLAEKFYIVMNHEYEKHLAFDIKLFHLKIKIKCTECSDISLTKKSSENVLVTGQYMLTIFVSS